MDLATVGDVVILGTPSLARCDPMITMAKARV